MVFLVGMGAPLRAERIKLKDLPHEEDPKEKKEKGAEPLVENVAEEFYQKGLNALKEDRLDQAEAYFDRALILQPKHRGAREGIELIMKILETPAAPQVVSTPDPKIQLMESLQKNLDAQMKDNNWEEAHETAEKIHAIAPDNRDLKRKTALIRKKLAAQAFERAKEREQKYDYSGAIDAYRVAATYANDPAIQEKIKLLKTNIAAQKQQQAEDLYVQALSANQQGKTEEAVELCKKALALVPEHFSAQRMLDRLQSKTAR